MIKRIAIIATFIVMALKVDAQMIVMKSDIVRDVALMPNIHVDFVVGEKHSVGIGAGYCPTLWGADIDLLSFRSNYRFWFNGRPFTRQYVGASLILGQHDITWKKDIHDGANLSLGLIFGHVMNLTKRWNLEFEGGFDVRAYLEKEYYKGDVYEDFTNKANSFGIIMFPHIAVSISYIIK